MWIIEFGTWNKNGIHEKNIYGGPTLEEGLQVLTSLRIAGWRFSTISVRDTMGSTMFLPIEAFDEISLIKPMKALQQEWEALLVIKV